MANLELALKRPWHLPWGLIASTPLLLLPLGCGRSETWGADLLQTPPSRILAQRGRLAVDQEAWVQAARFTLDEHDPGRLPPEGAVIALAATAPEDREIELSAAADASTAGVRLVLNEIDLGELTLEPGRRVSIEAPAESWFQGTNLLTIEALDESTPARLEALAFGPDREVEWNRGSTPGRLIAGTGIEFTFELPAPTRIEGTFKTDGDGIVQIGFYAVDGLDGSLSELDGTQIDLIEAEETIALDVPHSPDGPTLMRIEWLSVEGSPPLEVIDLRRVEFEPVDRPPIVFLSIDTLAAKNMSVYGYDRETTPNIAAFAEQCITFDAAKSNAPWTIPSYCSQLSGMHSLTHFVGDQVDRSAPVYERFVVAPNRWTLAEALNAAGYETHAIVDNSWMALVNGILQGFETRDVRASERPLEDQEGGMRLVLPAALEWLADREEGDFFLMLQILDTHGPYMPGPKWRGKFGSDQPGERILPVVKQTPATYGGVPDYIVRSLTREDVEEIGYEPIVSAYDEKLAEMDAEVGRFLDALQMHPLWDEMIVIISADHGESMGGHEFYFRHGILFDHTLHIPLMVRIPDSDQAGTRVSEMVDLLGLYPTVLDLVGLASDRPYLDGESFEPAVRGESLGEPRVSLAAGSSMKNRSVEWNGWKLVYYTPHSGPLQTILTHPPTLETLLTEYDGLRDRLGVPEDLTESMRTLARPGRVAALEAADPALKHDVKTFLRKRGPVLEYYYLPRDPLEQNRLQHATEEIEALMLGALLEMETQVDTARETGSATSVPMELSESQRAELEALGYLDSENSE